MMAEQANRAKTFVLRAMSHELAPSAAVGAPGRVPHHARTDRSRRRGHRHRRLPPCHRGCRPSVDVYANGRRPRGSGIKRPSSRAVAIHSAMTISAAATASAYVEPSAMQPWSSGTSTTNAASASLTWYALARPPARGWRFTISTIPARLNIRWLPPRCRSSNPSRRSRSHNSSKPTFPSEAPRNTF